MRQTEFIKKKKYENIFDILSANIYTVYVNLMIDYYGKGLNRRPNNGNNGI